MENGNVAQIGSERHIWEEATTTFKPYNTLEQAIRIQTIKVFEPIYLKILNNDMVGFDKTTARGIFDHLFLWFSSITAVGPEKNFENMREAWDPQQQMEILFKQIHECVEFLEAGGITIG